LTIFVTLAGGVGVVVGSPCADNIAGKPAIANKRTALITVVCPFIQLPKNDDVRVSRLHS